MTLSIKNGGYAFLMRLDLMFSMILFYNQIDGVVIFSPLAPVLVNIFMGFQKSKWFNEYNLNKP